MTDFELGGGVADPAVDLGRGDFAHAQAEGDVVVDRFVRIERVALEHHRDVALVRRQRVDDLVVEPQFALGDVLQPRDHVQRRGFAAAGRAEQDDELLVADLELEIVDGNDVAGVPLGDRLELDPRHRVGLPQPLTAPAVRPDTM